MQFEVGDYNLYRYCQMIQLTILIRLDWRIDTIADIGFIARLR